MNREVFESRITSNQYIKAFLSRPIYAQKSSLLVNCSKSNQATLLVLMRYHCALYVPSL